MVMTRETEVLGRKFVSLPLCPLQFPHGLTWLHTVLSGEMLPGMFFFIQR